MSHGLRIAALLCPLFACSIAAADDWPQWLGPKRDGVWRETGILEKFPQGGPKILWRTPIAGGYAGPAVAGARVYVFDYAATEGDLSTNPDARSSTKGKERLLCLDAKTGKETWKHEHETTYKISYSYGPRCTPTVADGKVYTLGAEGRLCCLDAEKGTEIWSHELTQKYKVETPLWGFAGHPLVDGKKLICLVGGEGSVAVAFNKETGQELWKALDAPEAGYCAPSIIEAGGTRQLLIWHPLAVNGLDPETGKVYWSVKLEPQYRMSIQVPRKEGDCLFIGGIGFKCLCLKLDKEKPAVEEVWRGDAETGVFPVNSTPFLEDDMIYAVCTRGELRGVKLSTGERLWETHQPTTQKTARESGSGTAFLVKHQPEAPARENNGGSRYFIFSELGDLIIARLSPEGYQEIDRAHLIEQTQQAFGRSVVWCPPAFAEKCIFVRNDKEIICASLAAE